MSENVLVTNNVSVESETTKTRKRIEWIDIAKFFGLVFVVIGHALLRTGYFDDFLRGLIYSFHLPLFFILSFITTSLSKDKADFLKKTKRRFIHLMIPYFVFITIMLFAKEIQVPTSFSNSDFWEKYTMKYLGYTNVDKYNNGIEWFLITLFLGQTLFDIIHLYARDDLMLGGISFFLTVVGVILGRLRFFMPFMLDVTLSSFIFFFIGYKLKNFNFEKRPLLRMIICLVLWIGFAYIVSIPRDGYFYYEAYARYYPFFPVCFISAVFGALTFMYLSLLLSKIKYVTFPLKWLGSQTLYWMMVHSFSLAFIEPSLKLTDIYYLHRFYISLIEIGITILVIFVVKFIKKIIQSQKEKKQIKTA